MVNGSACTIELWCTWDFAKQEVRALTLLSYACLATSRVHHNSTLSRLPFVNSFILVSYFSFIVVAPVTLRFDSRLGFFFLLFFVNGVGAGMFFFLFLWSSFLSFLMLFTGFGEHCQTVSKE